MTAHLGDGVALDVRACVVAAVRENRDWASIVLAEIARVLPQGGNWCDMVKAQTLAALILAHRPALICEIGVWTGGSMIPMLLALAAVDAVEAESLRRPESRRGLAIDAWSAEASCADQSAANRDWWSAQSHAGARDLFAARLQRHGLAEICDVVARRSDDVEPPNRIGLLHVDGNHGEQAVRDVERFGARVEPGGVLVMDDLGWEGGHVTRARDRAVELGFRRLYPLGTGEVLLRG